MKEVEAGQEEGGVDDEEVGGATGGEDMVDGRAASCLCNEFGYWIGCDEAFTMKPSS